MAHYDIPEHYCTAFIFLFAVATSYIHYFVLFIHYI